MKTSAIIFLLLFFKASFAQMTVEDIRSDNDVLEFIKQKYSIDTPVSRLKFKFYTKDQMDSNFFRTFDKHVYEYIDSINGPDYIIDDFNRDGKNDLIACLYFGEDCKVLSFCSKNINGYDVTLLSSKIESGCPHFLQYLKVKKHIIVGALDDYNYNLTNDSLYSFSERLRVDTIAFIEGFFVDYNFNKQLQSDIDTITFLFRGFQKYSARKIIIPKRGEIKLISPIESYNDSVEFSHNVFQLNWEIKKRKNFFDIAQSLPIKNYQRYYSPIVTVHDGYGFQTEIKFKDGTKKTIEDRLETGPLGLRILYKYYRELIASKEKVFLEKTGLN